MRTNLYQVRRALLTGTILWLGLAVLSTLTPTSFAAALALLAVAVLLYTLIDPSGEQAAVPVILLALVCFGSAAVSIVLLLHRLEWLNEWSWLPAIGAGWALTLAGVLRHYDRLITVSTGLQHIYIGPIRSRTVQGYRRIPPPFPLFERLLAVVPTRRLKLDFALDDVGTCPDPAPVPDAWRFNGVDPPSPPEHAAIRNLHRVDLAIEFCIDPDYWWMVNQIPCDTLVNQLRSEYGAQGRNAWHDPRYWSDLARGYVQEIAEELTRKLVHDSDWSALEVWRRKDELAGRLFENLREQAAVYGVLLHSVDIVDVVVDQPEVVRRARTIELMGATWQREQALVLKTFHETLQRLGLRLTPEDIEHLCRVHLWDLVSHLQRYGHLDFIVQDLVNGGVAFRSNERLN